MFFHQITYYTCSLINRNNFLANNFQNQLRFSETFKAKRLIVFFCNNKSINIKSEILATKSVVKKEIVLIDSELDEKFVRGSGNGGQKINTTANRVQLTHIPTGVSVSCQDARDLSTNRKIARKMLIDKLDYFYNGESSKLAIEHEKIRKKKRNANRRSKKKYSNSSIVSNVEESTVDDDNTI